MSCMHAKLLQSCPTQESGMEPVTPALADGFLSTVPVGPLSPFHFNSVSIQS